MIKFVFNWDETSTPRRLWFNHWVIKHANGDEHQETPRAPAKPHQYAVLVLVAKVQDAAEHHYSWSSSWSKLLDSKQPRSKKILSNAGRNPNEIFIGHWTHEWADAMKWSLPKEETKNDWWKKQLVGTFNDSSISRPGKDTLMGACWDTLEFELPSEFSAYSTEPDSENRIIKVCFRLLAELISPGVPWEAVSADGYPKIDQLDEGTKTLLSLYHKWKEKVGHIPLDHVINAFKPKNRHFVQWCRSHYHDAKGQAQKQIQQILKAMDSTKIKAAYTEKQHALVKWLAHVSKISHLQDGPMADVREKIGSQTEMDDVQQEVVHDHPIQNIEGEPFVRGSVLTPPADGPCRNSATTRTLLVRKRAAESGEPKPPSPVCVRVDRFTTDTKGHMYAHPAYALAVRRDVPEKLDTGMTHIALGMGQEEKFSEQCFRWALVEDKAFGDDDYELKFDEIADGHQIAAAALVAACVLRLEPDVQESLAGWKIWVQFVVSGPDSLEARTPDSMVFDHLLTAKDNHLILLVGSSEGRPLAKALAAPNRRFVYLKSGEGNFAFISRALTKAVQEPAHPQETAAKAVAGEFFGRKKSLLDLKRMLAASTSGTATICASIKGMGGIGKTEMAEHFATGLADHQKVSVDLWGHRKEESSVAGQGCKPPIVALEEICKKDFGIAATKFALLKEQHPDSDAYLEAVRTIYLDYLGRNPVIVILDNAFDEKQLRPLLPLPGQRLPSLFVVTSRHMLKIPGVLTNANRLELGPMDDDDVRQWLQESALAGGLEHYVEEVMAVTGGLPLAISIVVSQWHHRGRLMRGGAAAFFADIRNVPLSGASDPEGLVQLLTRCFTFSVQELSAEEREAFYKLAVFPARFDSAAVAAVCWGHLPKPEEALNKAKHLMLRLYSISLVEIDDESPDRYWLHDLVREFCERETQADPKMRRPLLRAFSDHYAAVMCYCGEEFRRGGSHSRNAAALFSLEEENFKRGHSIANEFYAPLQSRDKPAAAAPLIVYAGCAIRAADLVQTAMDRELWTQQAVTLTEDHFNSDISSRGRLLVAQGLAKRHLNKTNEAIQCMDDAEKLFESEANVDNAVIGDLHGNRGNLLIDLAMAFRTTANNRAEANARKRSQKSSPASAFQGWSKADLTEYWEYYKQAERQHDKAKKVSETLPLDRGLGQDLGNLAIVYAEYGMIESHLGHKEKAEQWFKKALKFYQARNEEAARPEVQDDRGRGNGLGNLGNLYSNRKMFDEAIASLTEALELHRTTNNKRGIAATQGNLASVFYHRASPDDLDECISLNEESEEQFRKLGDTAGERRSHDNAKLAEERLLSRTKDASSAGPGLHLADRYGKVTDICLDTLQGPGFTSIHRCIKLFRIWRQRP